jgi:hypothetical protein
MLLREVRGVFKVPELVHVPGFLMIEGGLPIINSKRRKIWRNWHVGRKCGARWLLRAGSDGRRKKPPQVGILSPDWLQSLGRLASLPQILLKAGGGQ